jgi:hypothetical protein
MKNKSEKEAWKGPNFFLSRSHSTNSKIRRVWDQVLCKVRLELSLEGHFFNVNSNNPVWVQLQGRNGKLLPPPTTPTAEAATTPTTSTTTTTQA